MVAAMQGAGSSATAQCFLLYLCLLWRNETKDVHKNEAQNMPFDSTALQMHCVILPRDKTTQL